MDNLQNWLKANQLDKYSEVLLQNDITSIELLNELTEDDLKELGFSMGDRKAFAIAKKSLLNNTVQLTSEELELINSLPYVIAYPLKRTLLEKHPWTKINLLKDTFLNYLKYLGLLSASEFFNSDIKDKGMVALFHKNLMETAFGKWNHYIRESLSFLKQKNHTFFYPELVAYYELVETGNKSKKYKGEIEYQDANGDTQLIVQTSITSIGMLINFRNRYLGHGQTLDEDKSQALWNEFYPIFKHLLEQLNFTKDYPMLKREDGETYLLHTAEIKTIETLSKTNSNIWIENKEGQTFDILPFFIVPGEVSLVKEDKEQLLTYESYTGKTIKFFSPEGTEKQTSGKILEKLNLLIRDKQKETPFSSDGFTKEEFLKRVTEENKLLLDTLIAEKKIIPGVYQHRDEIEIKLREWIGARANIFFIAAEAGSGKTNLLAEIQKQYTERELPSLLIRAGRMEKQTLNQQIAYLLNIDFTKGLEDYTSIAGTQAQPTFILIDGLNEANNAEDIWKEILELSKLFAPGSLKFVITNRANTKVDLERYIVSDSENDLLYGENNDNEKGLSAYTCWLTALDMKEMKGAWENYVVKDKSRFKPLFSFDDIATFDRALYNQINNPLILRLFLEIYNGKQLPKKGVKHLHIWQDWLKTFSKEEQAFLKLVADEIWLIGKNELLIDDLLKHEKLKPYFTSDIISGPYNRLKNIGWISYYLKDLNGYIGFTVEGSLFYKLGIKLSNQLPQVNIDFIHNILKNGTKLQKTAIESFLCEQSLNGNLDLVTSLIDAGNEDIDLSITPLFLFLKTFGVKATIEKVLENPTENDWKALLKLDEQLEELQLHVLRKEFSIALMPQNEFKTKESVGLGLNAIAIFDEDEAIHYLNKIGTNASFILDDANLFYKLGDCERKLGNYDKAQLNYERCLAIRLKTFGREHFDLANSYNNLGITLAYKGEYDKALENYEKSLPFYLKTLNGEHPSLADLYSNIGLSWVSKGEYDKALEYFEKSLAIYLKILGGGHPSVATSYNNIGLSWKRKGECDKALEYYEKSLSIYLKTLGGEHPDVATSYNNIGTIWDDKGEYDKALEYYEKSLVIDLKTLGGEHPSVATSYYNIGSTLGSKAEYDKALEYYEKSLSIRLKTLGGEHPDVASSYNNIGTIRDNKGEYDKALEYYEKCLTIRLKTLGREHPDVANSYNNIGVAWNSKAEYDKALDYYEKCMAIRLKTLGEEHPDVANSYSNIGVAWRSKAEYDKALEYYEKSLSIRLKNLGGEHPDVANSYNNIAVAWKGKGEYDKALEYCEKSLPIYLKTLGGEHPDVASSYNNIGTIRDNKGEYDKALEYYEKCLAIRLKTLGGEHPDVASSYNNIGTIWDNKGEYDKALEYYEKCLSIRLKTLGGDHPSVANSYNIIGSTLDIKGEYDKALEYYEKCLAIRLKTSGGEHPDVANSYSNIGVAWNSKAEYDKAQEYCEKCLAIELKTLGGDHPSVATSYNNIGSILDSKGEYDKALEYYEKCLAIRLKTLGGDHPSVANSYNNIAVAWKGKGEYDKVLEYYEKCLEIYLKTLDGEHPDLASLYFNIGNCKYELKFYLLAIDFFKKGFSTLKKGGFPFRIGKCYEALDNKEQALDYFIQSAEIRRNDPELGMEDESTKISIENTNRLAKEIGKENDLPDWIKNNLNN